MRARPARAARVIVVIGLIAFAWRSPVYAQAPPPPKPETQSAPAKPPKQPPAPLFPRHRRGIYKNNLGINVVDATPQSPPLGTDDPGVPDNGEWEFNFSAGSDRTTLENRLDLLRVDANYGLLPKVGGHEWPMQLKLEFPVAAIRTAGEPTEFGPGAVAAGVKFNFYTNEHAGLSLALYPQVEFAPPFGDSVHKGLAEPGQEIVVPLLVEKEFHAIIVVANAGFEKPINVPADSEAGNATRTCSVALGRAITRRLAAMVEWRNESALGDGDERLSVLNFGVIRGVRNVILYGNVGRSLSTSDDNPHIYLGVGIKLNIEPKSHKKP